MKLKDLLLTISVSTNCIVIDENCFILGKGKHTDLLLTISVSTNCILIDDNCFILGKGKHTSYFTKWFNREVELIKPLDFNELEIFLKEE